LRQWSKLRPVQLARQSLEGKQDRTGACHEDAFHPFATDESGATAIEYGLIAALIAVAAISAMTTLGTKLTSTFEAVSNQLK